MASGEEDRSVQNNKVILLGMIFILTHNDNPVIMTKMSSVLKLKTDADPISLCIDTIKVISC